MEIDAALWVLMAVAVAFVICGCVLTGRGERHNFKATRAAASRRPGPSKSNMKVAP